MADAEPSVRISDGFNAGTLHRALKHLCFPRSWRDNISVAAKSLSAPKEREGRRRLAEREVSGNYPARDSAVQRLRDQGWSQVSGSVQDAADAAARRMAKEFETMRANETSMRPNSGNKGDFFVPIIQNADFLGIDEVMALVTSRDLVDIAASYLGEAPVLTDICLRWSPVNDSARSSQLFHRDEEDATQLKFLLHVTDVDESAGPFTVLSAPATEMVISAAGRRYGRFTDEIVWGQTGDDPPQTVSGPRGTLTQVQQWL